MFRYIEPEVAGGFGKDAKLDTTVHPPIVYILHYEFTGWLGNDILESFPCYIVTEKLKNEIVNKHLTGVSFDQVKVTRSDEFIELYPDKVLPDFCWMKIDGKPGKSDFGVSDDLRLVISEKAYESLILFNLSAADLEEFENA